MTTTPVGRAPDVVLPRTGMRLPAWRRWAGIGLAAVGAPVGTAVLLTARDELSLGSVLLLYLLLVVVAAAVGGLEGAALAVVLGFLLANWFFVPPFHTFAVESRDALVELGVFVVVGGIVSLVVHLAAREQADAARSRFESQLLARLSAEPAERLRLVDVLEEVRRTFGMDAVELVRLGPPEETLAIVGIGDVRPVALAAGAGDGLELRAAGPAVFAEDRALLAGLAGTAARAWAAERLAREAARAQELAAADRVRSALLAAVGHDLRTPLAAIKASVSSLRADDVAWTPAEERELLESIEDGADRLDALVTNLLDLSRLQAGSLAVLTVPVAVDEVVARALLHVRAGGPALDVPDDLPLVLADPGLLERVVANLVDNALRYAPPDEPVRIVACVRGDELALAVVDHGPGVPEEDWPRLFVPFHRLDDRTSGAELGLGLAIAQGFTEAMDGRLTPSRSPGGGLTMTLTLPLAQR